MRQRGQGNFELATNYDYIHLGQLTQAKVSVSVGFQSLPETPTKCCSPKESQVSRCSIYVSNEPKSVLARELGDCRDNE